MGRLSRFDQREQRGPSTNETSKHHGPTRTGAKQNENGSVSGRRGASIPACRVAILGDMSRHSNPESTSTRPASFKSLKPSPVDPPQWQQNNQIRTETMPFCHVFANHRSLASKKVIEKKDTIGRCPSPAHETGPNHPLGMTKPDILGHFVKKLYMLSRNLFFFNGSAGP